VIRSVVESEGVALVVEGPPRSIELALGDGRRQGAGTVALKSACGAWVQVNPAVAWDVSLLDEGGVPG
jgi:hypothetical protein